MTEPTPPKKMDSLIAWVVTAKLGIGLWIGVPLVVANPIGCAILAAGVFAGASLIPQGDKSYVERLQSNIGVIGKVAGFMGRAVAKVGADLGAGYKAMTVWAKKEEAEDVLESRVDAMIAAETSPAPSVATKKITGFGGKGRKPANEDATPAPVRERAGPSA